jgi:hypothetical protein
MIIGVCRLPLLILTACLACALAAAPAGAQVPLTLTGETLKDPPGEGGTLATVSCNPTPGGLATASFESAGLATGPYTGTYTESGTFTVRTATRTEFPAAEGFQATFEIVSGPNVITGTKTFQSGFGRCEDDFGGGRDGPEVFAVAEYEARIETPNGVFRDRGTTEVVVQDRQTAPDRPERLQEHIETFVSALPSPIPDDPPPPPPPPPDECDGDDDGGDDDGDDDDGGGDDDCDDDGDDDGGGDG